MRSKFTSQVSRVIGGFLEDEGFLMDEVDESEDNQLAVVYYKSDDCKLQIYRSARSGEINCMIAQLDQQNQLGLPVAGSGWHFLQSLSGRKASPEELIENRRKIQAEGFSFERQPDRIVSLLVDELSDARSALLRM